MTLRNAFGVLYIANTEKRISPPAHNAVFSTLNAIRKFLSECPDPSSETYNIFLEKIENEFEERMITKNLQKIDSLGSTISDFEKSLLSQLDREISI